MEEKDNIDLLNEILRGEGNRKAMVGFLRRELKKPPEGEVLCQAEVLIMRYGLETGQPCTLEEIGRHFGRTRERIRQIEKVALRKLRHPNRINALRELLKN